MIEEAKFKEMLGIEGIKILKTEVNRHGALLIYVKTTTDEIHCRKCGKLTEKCHGVASEIKLRHLPMGNLNTYIIIEPKRGKCKECDNTPTTNQKADWYDYKQRQTKLFETHILLSLINSTVTDVSLKEDIGYAEVEGILNRRIDINVDWNTIAKIGALGIDEIAIKKGHNNYLTIVTSRLEETNTILKIIPGKTREDVEAFFRSIPKRLHKTILAICSDMYDGYINAAKAVFKATVPIVIDRFHVANLYRDCLVKLRISELKRLRKSMSENHYRSLKDAIAILKRNSEFVTDEEKKILKPLFKLSPGLKRAFKLCRRLTGIFNSHVPKRSASKKINHWISDAIDSKLTTFSKFTETLKSRQKEIVNYFNSRQNSGFVEGINNKIKLTKRRCYGLFHPNTLFQRLVLDLSGYQLLASDRA